MENLICQVCNNKLDNRSYVAYEMMLGLRDQFKYFKCAECGCLQIAEIPKDMTPYYPIDKYYSYNSLSLNSSIKSKLGIFIRKSVISYCSDKFNIFGFIFIHLRGYRNQFKWVTQLKGLKYSTEILDIGCGAGLLLQDLSKIGFKKLTGIDPFIEKDIYFPSGLEILKKNIYDIQGQFDIVMLNHCFEHMDNPNGMFEQLYKVLKPDGQLLIRIPVIDSYSWRKYGMDWFQIDAPRHFFLHTVKSMSILAKNHEFTLTSVEYDSTEAQFINSEKYIRDRALFENLSLEPKLINEWRKRADLLNRIKDGDQACFVFIKNSNLNRI